MKIIGCFFFLLKNENVEFWDVWEKSSEGSEEMPGEKQPL